MNSWFKLWEIRVELVFEISVLFWCKFEERFVLELLNMCVV